MIWYYSLVLEANDSIMLPVSLHTRSSEPREPCYAGKIYRAYTRPEKKIHSKSQMVHS